ncbi:aarF domain-containing protein kinase 1 isoform X2 [Vitis riparia]|uniref:aarF domain-containing protein kinase 1 isoform X2 n=1 Tax=Vitis riparia TaxID=96939 RepID=UPI00155A940B|nr:aarF domain-containing protein kinase 1 isoform X2 [Vitis riparia]
MLKFPAKAKTSFYLITATTGFAAAFNFHSLNPNFPAFSDDSLLLSSTFPEKIRTGINAVFRSSRAVTTIALNVVDYKYSLHGLPLKSEEYRHTLSEVHVRSAKRILKLCEANKGFYVKAGQFVAALRQVPNEYISILSSLQDQAVPCNFKDIKEVLIGNLGRDLSEIFLSFDEEPIAAASIAQVHRALLKDGREVQYPGLEYQMKLDTATMSFLSKSVAWFFPAYRFEWAVSEFAAAITLELDFIQEARNSERTAHNFKNNKIVRVPHVFWELTTRQVLTMQFCTGHKVDDLEFLKKSGINPRKVAKALVEVFAEMIFIHGFLHGDPHPGNILVSPEAEGRSGFSLVLLDHGIYKQLDETFRLDYCQLWKAVILLDSNKIQYLGDQFGVGKYSRYFPLIFTGRTIDSKSALGKGMSNEEKKKLKQELKFLKMEDISSFMESLPPDFVTILRADGLLRSLCSKLSAPQRVRLLVYGKYALYGLPPKLNPESDFMGMIVFSKFMTNLSYLQFWLHLEALEVLSWMEETQQLFNKMLRQFVVAADRFLVRICLSFPTINPR